MRLKNSSSETYTDIWAIWGVPSQGKALLPAIVKDFPDDVFY